MAAVGEARGWPGPGTPSSCIRRSTSLPAGSGRSRAARSRRRAAAAPPGAAPRAAVAGAYVHARREAGVARRLERAARADLDQAEAAAAFGPEPRAVAEGRDPDAEPARRREDALARGASTLPVDRCAPLTAGSAVPAPEPVAPERGGHARPKAHRLAPRPRRGASHLVTAREPRARQLERPAEPARQGRQRPQDSRGHEARAGGRRERGEVGARGTATRPPCPSRMPRSSSSRKQSGTSHSSGRRKLPIGPPTSSASTWARSSATPALAIDHLAERRCRTAPRRYPGREARVEAQRLRSVRGLRADRREGVGAALDDPGHVDERLDVVHDGRAAEQAPLDGVGRSRPDLAAPALERGEERRLLAAHVAAEAADRTSNAESASRGSAGPRSPAARASATAHSRAREGRRVLGADEQRHRATPRRHSRRAPGLRARRAGRAPAGRGPRRTPGSPSSPLAITTFSRRAAAAATPLRGGREAGAAAAALAGALERSQHLLGAPSRARRAPSYAPSARAAASPEKSPRPIRRVTIGSAPRQRTDVATGAGARASRIASAPSALQRAWTRPRSSSATGERSQCPRQ